MIPKWVGQIQSFPFARVRPVVAKVPVVFTEQIRRSGFGLRPASGESGAEERREASSESQPERNARRRAADGSQPLLRPCIIQARDERAV